MAYRIEKSLRCPMCGTANWEWEANRFAYQPVAERCEGCYRKEVAAHDLRDAPGVTIQLQSSSEARAEAARMARDAEAIAERDRRERELYGDDDDEG